MNLQLQLNLKLQNIPIYQSSSIYTCVQNGFCCGTL